MKTTIYILAAFLLITIACDNSENTNEPIVGEYQGNLVDASSCKTSMKSLSIDVETIVPDSLSCVYYSYDAETHILSLTHVNAGFNCCPGELYCDFNFNGNEITIQEFESESSCNCSCLFDLEFEIAGVLQQVYTIAIEEPYSNGGISFEINLASSTDGSVCVTRKTFPWGIENH